MAAEQKSTRKGGRRSKKKNDLEALEQKWENRFSQLNDTLGKLVDFVTVSRSNSMPANDNGDIIGDTGTSGVQRPRENLQTQESGSLELHSLAEDTPHEHFQTVQVDENDHRDVVSLAPSHREQHDIGLFSDEEDSESMKSENLHNQKHHARFSKYIQSTDNNNNEDSVMDQLKDLFGEDVKTKSKSDSTIGLVLDKSQIEVLAGSWRCSNPDKLTAYSEEYRAKFPVHNKSLEQLEVPSLDKLTSDLLVKRHGNKAYSSTSKKNTLYSPFMKSVEKLAYQGQVASRMGIVSSAYIQQALGSLLQTLTSGDVNVDRTIQSVRDIFAMSTTSLDQVARAGAFHHLIRRKAALEDTGLCDIKELKQPLVSLPLTNSGVFGDVFEQTLKDRVEKNKQLKELLPEIHVISNKSSGNSLGKRKGNSTDWVAKRQKTETQTQNSTYTPRFYSGAQRTNPRPATSNSNFKDDKNDKSTSGTGANFRRFNGAQGKGQQKK